MPARQYSVTQSIAFEAQRPAAISQQHADIMACFADSSVVRSNAELVYLTRYPINIITRAVNTLIKRGLLVARGKRQNPATGFDNRTVGLPVNA